MTEAMFPFFSDKAESKSPTLFSVDKFDDKHDGESDNDEFDLIGGLKIPVDTEGGFSSAAA